MIFSVLFLILVFFVTGILKVPFLTLWERKALSYIQNRKGPNKVSFLGILQPVSDGVKLIVKNSGLPFTSNYFLFFFSPFLSFLLMLFLWGLFPPPLFSSFLSFWGVLFFFCMSSLKVYTLVSSGWASNSKYSAIGAVRGAAQSISYEASLILSFFFPACFFLTFQFSSISYEASLILSFFFPACFFLTFQLLMAETNRAPFDFAEGESELVSGFNTEYSGLPFTLLFLAEYGNIAMLSFLFSVIFFSFLKSFPFFGGFVMFSFLWVRSTFPRFRYDFLMEFSWKVVLPIYCLFFFVKFF